MSLELGVKVAGLRQLRSALRRAENIGGSQRLGQAFGEAADLIVGRAAARARATGRRADARLADSFRASRSQARAAVIVGGTGRRAWLIGHEFGARHDVPRSTSRGRVRGWNQFPAAQRGGRFVYPSIAAARDDLETLVVDAVRDITTN